MVHALVGEVHTVARGPLPPDVLPYAQEKIARIARFAMRPVRFASVAVTVAENPAVERPVVAEAVIDVDGSPVRAHASGHEGRETIDLLEQRLRRRVDQLEDRFETRTRARSAAARPVVQDDGERAVVRRRSFAVEPMTPEEAAFDLEQLGHDFYLFVDLATGGDAVIYEVDHDVFGLRGAVDAAELVRSSVAVVHEGEAPTLSEADAMGRLAAGDEDFVFYADAADGRGRVAYRCSTGEVGIVSLT
jgi:ribosome-associated translation inhibitor RaiA